MQISYQSSMGDVGHSRHPRTSRMSSCSLHRSVNRPAEQTNHRTAPRAAGNAPRYVPIALSVTHVSPRWCASREIESPRSKRHNRGNAVCARQIGVEVGVAGAEERLHALAGLANLQRGSTLLARAAPPVL